MGSSALSPAIPLNQNAAGTLSAHSPSRGGHLQRRHHGKVAPRGRCQAPPWRTCRPPMGSKGVLPPTQPHTHLTRGTALFWGLPSPEGQPTTGARGGAERDPRRRQLTPGLSLRQEGKHTLSRLLLTHIRDAGQGPQTPLTSVHGRGAQHTGEKRPRPRAGTQGSPLRSWDWNRGQSQACFHTCPGPKKASRVHSHTSSGVPKGGCPPKRWWPALRNLSGPPQTCSGS